MKIKNEFKLIGKITKPFPSFQRDIVVGVGDDVAVIKNGQEYLLATTDMLVEDDHYNMKWWRPEQIGAKAVEVNVSDIIATGGAPTYMLVSICLTADTKSGWIEKVFTGIRKAAKKHRISLIGGDTTHGKISVINIAMLGQAKKPVLRSGAKPGDLICVTGKLGGSKAALDLFRKGRPVPAALKKRHLEPKARADIYKDISKGATAMIDVSDGLGSEVRHICEQSKTGAEIRAKDVPLFPGANLENALSGGEDFELVFTLPKNNLAGLKRKKVDFTVVGKILADKSKLILLKNNKNLNLPGGYDHFLNN